MMRRLRFGPAVVAVFAGALSSPAPAHAQPSQPPSANSPPPYPGWPPPDPNAKPPERWYGWQSLIVHGMSASLLAVMTVGNGTGAPFTIPTAVTGMVFAGPVVHWAHGFIARGFGALGLQFAGATVGALTGGAIACSFGGCDGSYGEIGFLVGGFIGMPIGATTAFALDVGLLSFEPRTEKGDADYAKRLRAPQLTLAPLVDIQKDRSTFGLAGTF